MELVIIFLSIIGFSGILLFLPIKGARSFSYQPPTDRFHEADAVLSRRLLNPGTSAYKAYYKEHPEFREADDRSRKSPGLLSVGSRYYHPVTFAAARANFQMIDLLNDAKSQPGNPGIPGPFSIHSGLDPDKTSRFIKTWLRQTGAHDVGFTRLEDYHLYSYKGRGPGSGEPIDKIHDHAIAITVEMDHRMMRSAPGGSSVMESSEQYLRSGLLAMKLAATIRELGYKATAHIDGNYEVICPLVAVDAGLGTIGRMGLLMTPKLGPRVRISVVTTNLPLSHSVAIPDRTTLHYCYHCKKCAELCPAAAIPEGDRTMVNGTKRWKIDSESCYHFWTLSGTDCGRCMSVCPYSHPDNLFHRFIRWAVKNNLLFRRLAIKLDDVFYGRIPSIRQLPDWTTISDVE